MVAQLVGFIVCSFCFTTIGSLIKKMTNWSVPYVYDFLIGLALSNAVFTLISLGYPINNTAAYLFITFVLTLFLLNLRYERIYFRRLIHKIARYTRDNPVLSCWLVIFTVLTFFQSLYSPSLHYDAGLYHIPSIKWLAEHKTTVGLVHLNSFIGYNFNIFALDAAFYTLFKQPIYPINLTVIILFSLWIFTKISRSIQIARYDLGVAYLLTFYYLLNSYWPHVSTPSTDTLVFTLSVIILVSVLELNTNQNIVFPIVLLATYATTIKLSAAPVLLFAFYILLTKPFWRFKKQALIALGLSGFVLIPWLVRNVLLTGWLLFPFPSLDLFSFDWKMSLPDVIARKEAVRQYYVSTQTTYGNDIQIWIMKQSLTDLFIIILCLFVLANLIFQVFTKKISLPFAQTISISISILGISFMAYNSPSLRYGAAFFMAIILLATHILTYRIISSKYIFYTLGFSLASSFLADNWFHPWHFAKHITQRFLLPYPLAAIPKKEFAYFLIDNRVKCYYPVQSDQCFDQTLPCANRKNENIHLRGSDLDQGFCSVAP